MFGSSRSTELIVLKGICACFFRYQRGSRSLAANLSMSQSASTTDAVSPDVEAQEQEEDYDIPEEVETVIGEFLPHLSLKSLSLQFFCSGNQICILFYRASASGTER